MSILDLKARPVIQFDPKNKKHRQYYAQYLIDRNWGNCPIRFYIEPGYGDLVSMIEGKLAWYFVSQETRKKLPKKEDSWVGR